MTKFRVEGLKEFSRQMSRAGKESKRELRQYVKTAAGKIIRVAQIRAHVVGGSAPKAARTLRVGGGSGRVTITGGGARAPFYMGNEFGSHQYEQFPSWRGNRWQGWEGGPGYMLIPAIEDVGREVADDIGKIIDDAWGT